MHILPATESHHHAEGMSLLTHSLEVAYRALIRAKTETWDDDLENHWQVAAMLTGLLSDMSSNLVTLRCYQSVTASLAQDFQVFQQY